MTLIIIAYIIIGVIYGILGYHEIVSCPLDVHSLDSIVEESKQHKGLQMTLKAVCILLGMFWPLGLCFDAYEWLWKE
jgi:hypothetical protein